MGFERKIKEWSSFFFRFGFSALLLGYLYTKIDTKETAAVLKTADFKYLFYGLLLFFVIHFFLFLRWLLFVRALKLKVPALRVLVCFFVGLFFNLFLPSSTGGDIVKTIGLFRDTSEKAKVVASVVCDRLSGFLAIVFIATAAYLFGFKLINNLSLLWAIIILFSVSMTIVLILFTEKLFAFFCGIFNRLPQFKEKLMSLHYAIVLVKHNHRAILGSLALSCITQSILAVVFYLVAKSLHQEIDLIYFIIFVPLICVVSTLPSIGGLGVREMGAVGLLGIIGVEKGVAFSISLINFLFMVIIGLVGGLIYLVAVSFRSSTARVPLVKPVRVRANPKAA